MIKINDYLQLEKGRYKILEVIGSGGYGIVWKVRRQSDGAVLALKSVNIYRPLQLFKKYRKPTVVKTLVTCLSEEIAFLQSLNEEAEKHYIVICLDTGVINDKKYGELPVMVMPLYMHDLDNYSYDHHESNDKKWPFDINDLLKWITQITTALDFIHQRHNTEHLHVHRDIKPENIMLNQQGDIGLTDFGIARTTSTIGTSSTTATFPYCAPEQRFAIYRKENHRKQYLITPAVDYYSLAMTIHELLAGSTRAQMTINDNDEVEYHHGHLLPAGTRNKQKIGYLGEIGGLTTKEKDRVQRQIKALLNASRNPSDTVVPSHDHLPNISQLASDFSGYLHHMLAPWPYDRPDAKEIKQWCQIQQQALQPKLEKMSLKINTPTVTVGEKAQLTLSLKGQGLSANLNWLELIVNEKPSIEYDYIGSEHIEFGYLQEDRQHHIIFNIILPDEVTRYTLRFLAYVDQEIHSAETSCEICFSAEQLWQQGQYKEALELDLRENWLNELEQKAQGSVTKKFNYVQLLKELLQHPKLDTTQKNTLEEHLKKANTIPSPRSNLLFGLIALIGIVIFAFFLFNYLTPDTSSTSDELKICRHLSNEYKDQNKVTANKALLACRKVKSIVGEGYVAKALYGLDKKEEAKQKINSIYKELIMECDKNSDACNILAYYHEHMSKDHSKTYFYSKKSCDLDDGVGCNSLGYAYSEGEGTKKDKEKAFSAYKKSCDLSEFMGCSNLGIMYQYGWGTKKDIKEAISLYKKACDSDDGFGCTLLASIYQHNKESSTNKDQVIPLYTKSCNNLYSGHACHQMGHVYQNGKIIEKDLNKAFSWYEKGCNLDQNKSCFHIGSMYENGEGVPVNKEKSISLYAKSCDLEFGEACNQLGYIYQNGKIEDIKQVFSWYEKGCNFNNSKSCFHIGNMYKNGEGIPIDKEKSLSFYKKGCDLDGARSCSELATIYEDGNKIEQKESRLIHKKACDLGSSYSCMILDPDKNKDKFEELLVIIGDEDKNNNFEPSKSLDKPFIEVENGLVGHVVLKHAIVKDAFLNFKNKKEEKNEKTKDKYYVDILIIQNKQEVAVVFKTKIKDNEGDDEDEFKDDLPIIKYGKKDTDSIFENFIRILKRELSVSEDGIKSNNVSKEILSFIFLKRFEEFLGKKSDVSLNKKTSANKIKMMITGAGVRFKKLSRSSGTIKLLHFGDEVTRLNKDKKWSKIITSTGQEGWIPNQYLIPVNPEKKYSIYLKESRNKFERSKNNYGDLVDITNFLKYLLTLKTPEHESIKKLHDKVLDRLRTIAPDNKK